LLIEANVFARFGAEWREARRFARAFLTLHAPKKPRVQGEALLNLASGAIECPLSAQFRRCRAFRRGSRCDSDLILFGHF
jgi:hypothetical protein